MNIEQALETINNASSDFSKKVCLSQAECSYLLGVSNSSLSGWRKAGIGPEYVKSEGNKGRVLYPKVSIAEWMVNNLIKTI